MAKVHCHFISLGRTPLGEGPLGCGPAVVDLLSAYPVVEKPVEGAGLAVFATRDLEAGSIIVEEPVCSAQLWGWAITCMSVCLGWIC